MEATLSTSGATLTMTGPPDRIFRCLAGLIWIKTIIVHVSFSANWIQVWRLGLPQCRGRHTSSNDNIIFPMGKTEKLGQLESFLIHQCFGKSFPFGRSGPFVEFYPILHLPKWVCKKEDIRVFHSCIFRCETRTRFMNIFVRMEIYTVFSLWKEQINLKNRFSFNF